MFRACFLILFAMSFYRPVLADSHAPFKPHKDRPGQENYCDEIIVPNMPPARSQDSLPICFALSSSVVAQYAICKKLPEKCDAGIPKSSADSVSPLSMLAWTRTNDLYRGVNEMRNHTNLQFYAGVGGATDALRNVSNSFILFSDACFPFDQLSATFSAGENKNADIIKNLISTIEDRYTRADSEGNICSTCLNDIKSAAKSLGVASLSDIEEKLKDSKANDENPGQFLYNLMLRGCESTLWIKRPIAPKFSSFPKQGEKSDYKSYVNKIQEVLRTRNPLSFDGICLEYDGKKCKTGHSVVISGYKKVCNKSVSCSKASECQELVKIQNSWGPEDNGWFDAKSLLSYATAERNRDSVGESLAWYF